MRRNLLTGTALVAAIAVVAAATPAWGTHLTTGTAPTGASDVLVFLRGPVSSRTAPRAYAAELSTQRAATSLVAAAGAHVLALSSVPDVLFVHATTAQARELANAPGVEAVLPNTKVPGPTLPTAARMVPMRAGRKGAAHAGPCGTALAPESDPEALANIDGTSADTAGYDGAGATVAIIGDALSPANPDLLRNAAYASAGSPAGSHVVTDYGDFSGDGPNRGNFGAEAFGDASSIAAQGNEVYNLSKYAQTTGANYPLPKNCDIRITGDAPGSNLIALKLFGGGNFAYAEQAVQAINYAVAHGASVISESFGFNNFPDTSEDAIKLADSAAVSAGVTVVVSSGDAGPNSTIASPASDPDVLTVGATTTYRAYQQLTYGGINALGGTRGYVDNNISSLSSGGVAFDGKTVNLVAPGDLNWAICSGHDGFFGCGNHSLELFGGTSESAPLTAGAAADVIQAYKATHAGVAPSPRTVMGVLTSTARDVHAPADQQGAGLLQVGAAVQLAASLPGTSASAPHGGILADTSQFDLTGAPGSTQSADLGFTNTSASPMHLAVVTRVLMPAARQFGVAKLADTPRHPRAPTFIDTNGTVMSMRRIPITVTSNTARVQFQATFAQDFFDQTAVSLFDPHGRLAAYSLPQGNGGFADVEAATNGPGTWTAVVYRPVGAPLGGAVPWSVTWWQFQHRASCSPSSLLINPGQQVHCDLALTMPAVGGDSSLAVVASTAAAQLTIPVTLRTQIPVSPYATTLFKGIVSGGNGRGGAAGQTNTYSFNVTPGEHDLDVAVVLAGAFRRGLSNADEVGGILVDPNGAVAARSDNLVRRRASVTATTALQLYAADPIAGTWQLLLVVGQPVNGAHVLLPFTGTIAFNQLGISSTLPDSVTARIPASGRTYSVDVNNTGVSPMSVALDPRASNEATVSPTLDPFDDVFSAFFVPPMTETITVEQTSPTPSSLELEASGGNPVLTPEGNMPFVTGSTSPEAPSLEFQPPTPVATGVWEVFPALLGPFTQLSKNAGITDTVALTTLEFDHTVRTNANDVAQAETIAPSSRDIFGRYLPAGTGVRLAVAIRPTAPHGTVVQGTLLVEDVDEETGTLNLMAAIPYKYVAP